MEFATAAPSLPTDRGVSPVGWTQQLFGQFIDDDLRLEDVDVSSTFASARRPQPQGLNQLFLLRNFRLSMTVFI
jgi:hypothetical protein